MTQLKQFSAPYLRRFRAGLLLALPIVLLINFVIWGAYSMLIEQQHQQWWLETERGLDRVLTQLDEVRNDLHGDLALLAASPNLKALLEESTTENLGRLASEWEVFTAIKRRYDQVRWLDNQGLERLRINRTPQGAQRVGDSQLQDKSDRYYFKEAISLPAGQVYASPIDLNIELGEIERPLKPMLRLAVPVTDGGGNRRGLLLVNVLAQTILDDLATQAGFSRAHLLMVDPEGYYVRGFRKQDAWGFMFKRDDEPYRFDKGFPQVWREMIKQGSGKVDGSQGRFLFRGVRYGTEGFSQRYFLVLAAMPSELALFEQAQRPWWLAVSLLVSLILVVLCLTLAYYLFCCRQEALAPPSPV
jgi:hypothetical protein